MFNSEELVTGCLQRGFRKPMEVRQTEMWLETRLGSRHQGPSIWINRSRRRETP